MLWGKVLLNLVQCCSKVNREFSTGNQLRSSASHNTWLKSIFSCFKTSFFLSSKTCAWKIKRIVYVQGVLPAEETLL